METLGVRGDNYKLAIDGFNHVDNTVYHGNFKVEKFSGFHSFYMIRETFYMEAQDGAVQIWI